MTRLLRVVACLFLVPLVVFANATTAEAATSGVAKIAMNSGFGPMPPTICRVPWSQVPTGISIGPTARCDGGVDVTPGYCQPMEGTCGMWAVLVRDELGKTCGGSGFETREDEDTTMGVVLGPAFVGYVDDECPGTQLCLSYYQARDTSELVLDETDIVECVPLDVDPQGGGGVSQKCPSADVTAPAVKNRELDPALGQPDELARVVLPIETTVKNTSEASVQWTVYLLTDSGPGSTGSPTTRWYPQQGPVKINTNTVTIPAGTSRTWVWGAVINDYFRRDQINSGAREVIGVGLAPRANVGDIPHPDYFPALDDWRSHVHVAGITNAQACLYYWGQKVTNNPNTDADEPVDVVNEGEEPTTPTTPEVEEPGGESWLSILWRALQWIFGKLGEIVTAVLSLPGKIVDLLGDALDNLFVPSDGFFDEQADRVSDEFEGSTLDNYVGLIGDAMPSVSGGCAGPTVTFNALGVRYTGNPLDACGGSMATLASVSRAVLGASVALTALFACVRITGRAFGWDPGVGTGAAS